MKLNIIGNGFDLYHGLPSSYYYFGCFLIANNPKLYEKMADWFFFRCYKVLSTYPEEKFDYVVENKFWSQFEEQLGIIDESAIVETYDYDLGLEIEDYDIPMDDDSLAEDIRKAFVQWVSKTLDLDSNYAILKEYKQKKKLKKYYTLGLSNADKFLVFNYTHTLQQLYKIYDCNICYVHGECSGDEEDYLLLGHANEEKIREIEGIISKYDRRALYQSERTRQLEYKCLLRFILKLKKDIGFGRMKTENFLYSFETVPEKVCVYGMSLGDVDLPYFRLIKQRWPSVKWEFSYFSKADKERILYVAEKLQLKKEQYTMFCFDNPEHKNIMKKIVRQNNITEYEDPVEVK